MKQVNEINNALSNQQARPADQKENPTAPENQIPAINSKFKHKDSVTDDLLFHPLGGVLFNVFHNDIDLD